MVRTSVLCPLPGISHSGPHGEVQTLTLSTLGNGSRRRKEERGVKKGDKVRNIITPQLFVIHRLFSDPQGKIIPLNSRNSRGKTEPRVRTGLARALRSFDSLLLSGVSFYLLFFKVHLFIYLFIYLCILGERKHT